MTDLRIARNLRLPLDLAVEATAVIGKRGRGKTFTAKRIVEEVIRAGVTVLIIDPTDVWYGLTSGADGTAKDGLDLYVIGGKHGNLPVQETAGKPIARAVLDGTSIVLCPKGLPKSARRRLVGECLTELYDHADGTPILVVIDEADEYAPEGARSIGGNRTNDPLMLSIGAVEDIVRRGRAGGLGSLLITQRVAVLAKSVLEQSDTLIALGVTGKNDIDAVAGWISKHAPDTETGKQITSSLPSLPTGTAWVWSPEYGVLDKVQVLPISTFDSSRTPKVGEVRVEPKARKAVDLAALGAEMEKFAEQVKADDPRELRKRIAELERHRCPEPAAVEPERVEVPIWTEADREFLTSAVVDLRHLREELGQGLTRAESMMAIARDLAAKIPDATPKTPVTGRPSGRPQPTPPAPRARAAVAPARPAATSTRERRPAGDGAAADITPRQQQILDQLAWFEAVGLAPADRRQLAFFVGLSARTGNFQNLLSRLSSAGLIDYPKAGHVGLTSAGRSQATDSVTTPATNEALQAAILDKLTPRLRDVLRSLIAVYPEMLSREDIAAALGLSAHTGNFQNLLSKLRTLELIDYPEKGYVAATSLLFLNA